MSTSLAGADARLIAENSALTERLHKLAPVLTGMVHDLAAARRENAALRRENLRLKAQIARPPAQAGDFAGRGQAAPRRRVAA